MALSSSAPSNGGFAVTKLRLFLAISLAFTWWIASLLPSYQPMIQAQFKSRIDEARQKIPSIKVDWQKTADPRAAYHPAKLAMIIEPRVMPHLVPQLLHMIAVVPPDWRFLFIGSPESVTMLGRSTSVKHQQVVGKLDLMVLPEPWDISSKEMVHRTLTDMRFYDEFLPGIEWLLKYEYDSILCANSEVSLNEWLDWHWAGAPRTNDDRFSGNGGLTLRRISAVRKILQFQSRFNDTAPEDEWFGSRLYITPGLKVASGLEGVLTVENVYIENPMGFHVQEMGENLPAEVWGDQARRKEILNYCPELYTVLNAKLDRERCPGDTGSSGTPSPPQDQAADKAKQEAEIEEKKQAMLERIKSLQAANAADAAKGQEQTSSVDSQAAVSATPNGEVPESIGLPLVGSETGKKNDAASDSSEEPPSTSTEQETSRDEEIRKDEITPPQ